MGSSVTKRERKLLDISFFSCKFAKKHRLFVSFLGMEGGDFAKKNISPFLGRNETRWEEGRKIRPALKVSQICICEFSLSVSFPLSAGVNLPYQTEKENTFIFLKNISYGNTVALKRMSISNISRMPIACCVGIGGGGLH